MKRRDFLKAGVLAAMSAAAKPAPGGISLSGPTETGICAGETVPLIYTLTKGPGKALLTTFSVSGLPSGVTGTFSPVSCTGGCGTTLTLRAAGSYALSDTSFIVRAQNSKGVAMANTSIKPRCAVAVQPPPGPPPSGNTRLGLHVTSDELAIWRTRAVSGPYKTAGDVSTNSPGDWDRIVTNKTSFMSSAPSIWNGPAGATCINDAQNDPPSGAEIVRDAAFYAMVKQDATVAASVADWIVNQQAPAQLDFSNRTKWCEGAGHNPEFIFTISEWMNRLIFAMDYVDVLDPANFTSGERTTLQNWFLAFADFTNTTMDASLEGEFVDRPGGNYTLTGGDSLGGTPYYGGAQMAHVNRLYNNRRGTVMNAVAQIGVKFNNATYKAAALLYSKEVLRFGVYPEIPGTQDGYVCDFLRWSDGGNADKGWQYGHAIVGQLIGIADVLARDGDTTLYNYSTSLGYRESVGGPKTVLTAMETIAKYVDHTYDRYGTDQPTENNDPNFRIDGRLISNGGAGQNPGENTLAIGNVYYQSDYIKSIYMRTASGTIAYPTSGNTVNNGAFSAWMGNNGYYPGVLFMWGQLEGVVNPY